MGCWERGGGGGGCGRSIMQAGEGALSLKLETKPPGLSYGRAVGNGCRRRWRGEVGCRERGGGGGWCGRSIMQVGVGLGAKKNRKPAFGAWFWAGYGLGMGQQPLMELNNPLQ